MRPAHHRSERRGPARQPVAPRPARADARPGPDDHAGRLRIAGDLDGHADRRQRARRAGALRLGLLGVLPRLADRHRGGRWRDRPRRAGHPVRGRSRAVRHRPAHRRPGAIDADPGRRPVPPGARCRHDPADRLRRHRADAPRIAAAADVRDAVDGVGPARRHRPGDRRDGRRHGRLALRLPRPVAAHRVGRGPDPGRPARDRRRASAHGSGTLDGATRASAAGDRRGARSGAADGRADERPAHPDRRPERRRSACSGSSRCGA